MRQTMQDWSGTVVHGCGTGILDPSAVARAREHHVRNNPRRSEECGGWDDATFLNKIGLAVDGEPTYAAIILLGDEGSIRRIEGARPGMRWILRDPQGLTRDSELYSIPLILAVDAICAKIRNLRYEYFRPGSLVPDRMETYEPEALREMIHNCIAHQDYLMYEFASVVEYDGDRLVFSNAGEFLPGTVENALRRNAPSEYYRNRVLAEAMAKLGMVDIAGGGIRRVFGSQASRFFPLPEYDLSDGHVVATITGRVIDTGFAEVLMNNPGIPFGDIVLLDRVQKGLEISKEDAARLRKKGFIGGRRPNYIISASLAGSTEDVGLKADAIRKSGFDDQYYMDLVVRYITEYGGATKPEIRGLLTPKLPDVLSEEQKETKIKYILYKLSKKGTVSIMGSRRHPRYVLNKTSE